MKKSKFLKKSLAMLLALMLVVAMIPLSASAALPDDLMTSIYVNGISVDIEGDSFTADVTDTRPTTPINVWIGTVGNLFDYGYQLRVVKPNSGDSDVIEPYTRDGTKVDMGTQVALAEYGDGNKFTLELYDPDQPQVVIRTYTLALNLLTPDTTANVADVIAGKGVEDIIRIENGDPAKIYVELSRHNGANGKESQDKLDAEITVVPEGNATVITEDVNDDVEGTQVYADNGNSFIVQSASAGTNKTYTIEVTNYVDALESFSVNGVDGVITDEKPKDNVPDTITVTLPKSVLIDTDNQPKVNVNLAVEYKAQGNTSPKVYLNAKDVATMAAANLIDSGDVENFDGLKTAGRVDMEVIVDRLGPDNGTGAVQHYDLVVKLEDSTNTEITYAQFDRTAATVDAEAGTIVAEMPKELNDSDATVGTKLTSIDVTLFTDKDVSKIVVAGVTLEAKNAVEHEIADINKQGVIEYDTYYAWRWNDVDLLTSKRALVTSENSAAVQTYTLTATMAEDVSAARITGFQMVSPSGYTAVGDIDTENLIITVTVPYMTLNVADWRVYATTTASAKAVWDNGSTTAQNEFDIVNGWFTGNSINLGGTINADTGLTWDFENEQCIRAVAKNDETIHTDYQVKIVLDEKTTGHSLQDVDFTAQHESNNNDRSVSRAIEEGVNTFDVEVGQKTNLEYVAVTAQIPPSLQSNTEMGDFNNIITNVETGADGGVVFGVTARGDSNLAVQQIVSLSNNADEDDLNADLLVDFEDLNATGANETYNRGANSSGRYAYGEILVLPEEYARKVLIGEASTNGAGFISIENVKNYGTLYRVRVEDKTAETGTELKSFSVGGVELTITSDNKIQGIIPWSATVTSSEASDPDNAKFVDFEVSKYARLVNNQIADPANDIDATDSKPFYPNGDMSGDGDADPMGNDNMGLVFVRNADHSVTIYRAAATVNTNAEIKYMTVEAEDRLTETPYSSAKYTFDLEWAEASNEAEITSFKIGDWTGDIDVVDTTHRTINVQVPYGTDLNGLVAEFTTSTGATVRINNSVGGIEMESGVTSVNYNDTVKLYVTSESGERINEFAVTVDEGITFSDINSTDWFYQNVVDAANNGYVSGYPDGTFQPRNSITRAEFATMIANALDYEQDPDAPSAFPDVADDYWAKAAINFCAQNGIISGYDTGDFEPTKAITRQEAASILKNAFELTGTTSELFPDDSGIANWAKENVYAVKAAGLMKGDADTGNFRATSTITRAEAASILMNAKNADMIK